MKRAHRAWLGLALAIALASAGLTPRLAAAQGAEALPPGFVTDVLTTFPDELPTDVALALDGRLLITTQVGRVWVVADGARRTLPALDLSAAGLICNEFERGLQSVEVDPAFAANGAVYVYYTHNRGTGGSDCSGRDDIVNRVVRYRLTPQHALVEPVVILDNIASPCGNHNGGDLHFGADGMLYVSTGDGGTGDSDCRLPGVQTNNARYLSVLNGKVLRIRPDGSVPADNPFASAPGAAQCGLRGPDAGGGPCRETFAWGFRNPFRFAVRPGTNQLFVNDVGRDNWEEISDVTRGNDYGWHCREGRHDNPGASDGCEDARATAVDPIHEYPRGGALCAITAAAFAAAGGRWPSPYADAYFFGDLCSNAIYRLIQRGDVSAHEPFARLARGDSLLALHFDPQSAALYFATSRGRVGVIRYGQGANLPPLAVAAAAPTDGAPPLTVRFSSAGSADPEGGPLTYRWNFGDGSPASSEPNPTHTYAISGTWSASLVVADAAGAASEPARVTVHPGSFRPDARIVAPAAGARFSVGQVIPLSGIGTDARGSDVSSTLQWRVLLHYVPAGRPEAARIQSLFTGTGKDRRPPPMPAPEDFGEDFGAAERSFVEIQLTARDVKGLTHTVTRTLEPNRVPLTFTTDPPGLRIDVNGLVLTATRTIASWEGYEIRASTPSLQRDAAGRGWRLKAWSGGDVGDGALVTPGAAARYVATFERVPQVRTTHLPLVGR